mmetsp:Transcript_22581/g.53362  ORF Transcript_22581/g.53362 Transcript_22581/m.53362 type:complete len:142 (-) Transcript_22581:719-1144(-)
MGCGSSQEAGPGALSEDEIRTVLTVELVVNSLSIIGSSFIIACWICFPSLRKFAFTLVLYLSISDVMGGFAALLSPGDDTCGATCLFQAYLVSIFGLSSVFPSLAHLASTLSHSNLSLRVLSSGAVDSLHRTLFVPRHLPP